VIRRLARGLGAPLAIRDPMAALDAIVVLGAPLLPDGRLSDIVAERARAAAALYHAGGAPLVCPTGRNEADAIALALLDHGVPDAALRIERDACTTRENATRVAALLEPDGVRSVWLVTQPFHARRSRWHFRRVGLDAHVWHIDGSLQYERPARALKWIAREYAAWAVNLARR
jgi:uncharacterized SAM-binding protein YcdF (DUF218 family)